MSKINVIDLSSKEEENLELYEYFITFPSWSPGSDRYCVIEAPNKTVARILAFENYRRHWAFIYSYEQFRGQIKEYNLSPTKHSPLTSAPMSRYYLDNSDTLLKEAAKEAARLSSY